MHLKNLFVPKFSQAPRRNTDQAAVVTHEQNITHFKKTRLITAYRSKPKTKSQMRSYNV
jgi:hypothetical protein